MLKKVKITNVHSGKSSEALVDTDSDEKALIGAGRIGTPMLLTTPTARSSHKATM